METFPRWGSGTKLLISAMLLILAGLVLYGFRGILAPLIIALLGAYILAPVVGWISRHLHIRRGWAVALIYLVGLAILATAPAITASVVTNDIENLWTSLNAILNQAADWLAQPHEFHILAYTWSLPPVQIPELSTDLDKIISLFSGTISPIAGGAFSVIKTVASGVGWLALIAMLTFYLLVDANRIGPALLRLVPVHYRGEVGKLLGEIDRTWSRFLRGQLVLCLIIGTLVAIATSIVGLRFSLALGIVAGILEIVPSLGPTLAAVPAILLALFQGATNLPTSHLTTAIIVAIVYWGIQILENNLLVPRIMGSTLKLPPLMIIVGVVAGATLGGILGALLAAPTIATLRDIMRYIYCKLVDVDPFPEPPSFPERVQERGVRAILFDLDGTLLNTDDVVVARIARRLQPWLFLRRLYDGERLARRMVMAAESPLNLVVTALDILGLDNKFLSFGEWLRTAYGQRDPAEYVAVDGVVRFVRSASASYDLAVVTTRNRKDTEAFLRAFDLQDCFKSVVTRQDVKRLKPHPEPVARAARELGVPPEQCIVVGDTTVDVRSGQRAGMLTVGVLCGFGERGELARLQADLILETTSDLEKHLPEHMQVVYKDW